MILMYLNMICVELGSKRSYDIGTILANSAHSVQVGVQLRGTWIEVCIRTLKKVSLCQT